MSELTNAKRIARDQARINDLMDLLREKPTLSFVFGFVLGWLLW